jgi:hypothetical protein
MCPRVWLRCEIPIDHLIAQDIPISDLAPIPAAVDQTDARKDGPSSRCKRNGDRVLDGSLPKLEAS